MTRFDLSDIYPENDAAALGEGEEYVRAVTDRTPPGATVVLTGQAPVWLYLRVSHALNGVARRLYYQSPVTGRMLIFDHDPRPRGRGSAFTVGLDLVSSRRQDGNP